MDLLVTTQWLADNLSANDLRIVDSSWHMPATGRRGPSEFEERHIPGAVFLDIDTVADTGSGLPHMLPRADAFAAAAGAMGIAESDRIVVYDHSDTRNAVRGWFMFRHFGARQVAVLDGGLGKWLADGRPVERGQPKSSPAVFRTAPSDDVVTKGEILAGAVPPLLDARGAGRFDGSEPDPRPGVAPGHIPGARSLPFGSLYRSDGTFRDVEDLRRLFDSAGIDSARPFTATCGSGVTANSLIFAAALLGNDDAKLYDGSWSEWGGDPATPKAVGPADQRD